MDLPEGAAPGPGPESGGQQNLERLEKVAESFVERCHRGERPTIEEYVEKHPDLAREIREILPTLRLMEEVASPRSRGKADAEALAPAGKTAAPGELPAQLGEYRILREIGRGGMGVVYEAVQETLGRRVALKVLQPQFFKDQSRIERFLREARAAARLHHTNIVPVFGVGDAGGTHYYAMQFIRGQGLDQVLRELRRLRTAGVDGPPPDGGRSAADEEDAATTNARNLLTLEAEDRARAAPSKGEASSGSTTGDGSSSRLLTGEEGSSGAHRSRSVYFRNVAQLGLHAAEALVYAHSEGIIHRDIKPSNLLLDTQGAVWITDFGLAKAEGSDELTEVGDLLGTLRYMAPERFKGWSDARSDVYGLGLTLYELLTLRAAFQDSRRANLVRKVLEENPTRPRRIDHQIPLDLETIVHKAIEKEPGRRYGSAGEMAADLRRFLSGEPIRARTVGNLERGWRWCLRNPAWTGLFASIAVLLTSVAAISLAYSFKLAERNREAQQNLWTAYLEEARALRYGGRSGRRFEALEAIRKAAAIRAAPELRDEAVACLAQKDVRVEREWTEAGREQLALAFDSAGERFAIAPGRGRRGIAIRRSLDGAEVGFLDAGEADWVRLEFSPDDRFLAEAHRGEQGPRLRVWDVSRSAVLLDAAGPAHSDTLNFASDHSWIAVGQTDGQLLVYNLEANEVMHRITPGMEMKAVAFHPSGRQLAVSSYLDGRIRVFDLGSGASTALPELPSIVNSLAFSPDGELLAAACLDARTYLYRTDLWQISRVLEGHENSVLSATFSHQGDFLATWSWDGTSRFWDPWSGRCFLSVSGHSIGKLSRDDRRQGFVRSASQWGIWEVATGREFRSIGREAGLNRSTQGLDFSPDGRFLAFVTDQGWGLWDVQRGRRAAFAVGGFDKSILFEPDGGGLIVSGDAGVRRFPIVRNGKRLRLGPPALLAEAHTGYGEISLSRDGHRLLVAEDVGQRSILLDRGTSWVQTASLFQAGARFAALSPTGRWAATATWHASGVKVWDAASGHPIKDLPVESSAGIRFSPDERWLVSSSDREYSFWSTETWSPVRRIPLAEGSVLEGSVLGYMAFSPDGGLLAIDRCQTHVELLDPATGDPVVRLELPGAGTVTGLGFAPIGYLAFSGDGSLLAAAMRRSILIWDLRRIRDQLRPLGLDWNAAPYPPRPALDGDGLLEVEIDPGPRPGRTQDVAANRAPGLRGRVQELDQRIRESPREVTLFQRRGALHEELLLWKEAIADYESCLMIEPTHEWALNALAWLLVIAPPEFRDPQRAAALASESITRSGDPHLNLNTLGVACYRLGRYDEAVKHLQESNHDSSESERPYNEFFLALSHHQLKNRPLAEWYYQRALAASASVPVLHADLIAIGAEAAEVLGKGPGKETGPSAPPDPK